MAGTPALRSEAALQSEEAAVTQSNKNSKISKSDKNNRRQKRQKQYCHLDCGAFVDDFCVASTMSTSRKRKGTVRQQMSFSNVGSADDISSFSETEDGDDSTSAAAPATTVQATSKYFIPLGQFKSTHVQMCAALVREVHFPWGIKLHGKKYERCREIGLRQCINNCGRQACSTHVSWGCLCDDCSSWWCPACTLLKPLHTCVADVTEREQDVIAPASQQRWKDNSAATSARLCSRAFHTAAGPGNCS